MRISSHALMGSCRAGGGSLQLLTALSVVTGVRCGFSVSLISRSLQIYTRQHTKISAVPACAARVCRLPRAGPSRGNFFFLLVFHPSKLFLLQLPLRRLHSCHFYTCAACILVKMDKDKLIQLLQGSQVRKYPSLILCTPLGRKMKWSLILLLFSQH